MHLLNFKRPIKFVECAHAFAQDNDDTLFFASLTSHSLLSMPNMKFLSYIGLFSSILAGLYASPWYNIFLETYSVIIDAGSRGTRIYVYKFSNEKENWRINVSNVSSVSLDIPLTNFLDKPADVTTNLIDRLLNYAERTVPEEYRNATKIYLKSTGGIRGYLGECRREDKGCITEHRLKVSALYKVIHDHIKNRNVFSDNIDISTISITEEAFYGWVGSNFALFDMHPEKVRPRPPDLPPCKYPTIEMGDLFRLTKQAISLEMGGASTQVVYSVGARKYGKNITIEGFRTKTSNPAEEIINWKLASKQVNLFQGGYEGFGM